MEINDTELEELSLKVMGKTHESIMEIIYSDLEGNLPIWNLSILMTYYRLIRKLSNCGILDSQVSDEEHKEMREWREKRFSINQLAFMFDRSKATIHAHVGDIRVKGEKYTIGLEEDLTAMITMR